MTQPSGSTVITIERAWRSLLDVLIFKNPGRVRSSKRALRYVRRMQVRH